MKFNFRNRALIIASFILAVILITSLFLVIERSVLAIGGLLAIFGALYISLESLVGKVFQRDERLQVMNEALEKEIVKRKRVEEELSIHRDYLEGLITEGTKELEIKNQEIEASEKKFRTITASIQDAIIMIDEAGAVSFWSQSAHHIFGYKADEIQGELLFQRIVPQPGNAENVAAFKIFKETHKEEMVEEIVEVEAIRRNGEIFPIEIRFSVVNIQGALNTVAVVRDVTRKKEKDKEIQVLSSAVEQSSVGIMITDTDGMILYVNPRFTVVTGYSREEVLGKTPNFLNSNLHPREFFKDLWDTICSGKEWSGEFQNRKKNGEVYWDSTLISPILGSRGNITHFVAIKEDITERKRMESQLIAAHKAAEAASRSKSEFLANMSHELRTPMNAIIGMTELALDLTVTNEQQEYLKIVQHSSHSLLNLLNDILDLSKIEAGKLLLEPVPFNLHRTLGESAKTLAVQAHKKGLELVYYIDSEVPSNLIGDMGRLRQVIVNLIGNSIKFTQEGEIVLKVGVMEEEPEKNKILLHFLISDTGIGIPEEKVGTIFEKFSQADTSTTRKYGGSGLGLTISSRLVQLMEGLIWVDSPATFPHFIENDNGSTFHFTASFEIHRETPRESGKCPDLDFLKGVPVLIVDDNQTNRRFLQEVLTKYGLEPQTSGSGAEALELLEKEKYELLILDYQMPEMDGAMVLRDVRETLQLDLPVVLLSSGFQAEVLEKLRDLKIFAHLYKPVNSSELMGAIASAMGCEEGFPVGGFEAGDTLEGGEGVHILVAEDNRINQQLIKRLLEKRGHRVDMADNGSEAVELFRKYSESGSNPYRVIFMDIQMPVMDGIKATREIREIDQSIPIIALTAHAMKGDKLKFLGAGMNDYISKPIKKAFLFETLDKYINREY